MFDNLRMRRWVGLTIAAPLGACASGPALQTLATPTGPTPVEGVPYYLPLASVPLTLTGAPGKAADSGGGGGAGAPAAAGGGAHAAAAAAAPPAPAAAPSAPYAVTVALGQPQYRPDPSELHFLSYTHDEWADDTQSIRVDQNGLLSSASMTSLDETSAVLNSIAQLAGEIASLPVAFAVPAAPLGIAAPGAGPKVACDLPPYSWTTMLPLDAAHTETIRAKPGDRQWVTIAIRTTALGHVEAAATVTPTASVNGVLFRAPTPYEIDITATPSPDAIQDCGVVGGVTQAYVALPNGGPVFVEDMSRARAVKNSVSLTIQNGMLTGVDPVHPSEANGYAQIPVTVLKTIVSIPASLFTLHIQQVQNEGNLASANATLAKNELDWLNNQQALAKAAASASPPPK